MMSRSIPGLGLAKRMNSPRQNYDGVKLVKYMPGIPAVPAIPGHVFWLMKEAVSHPTAKSNCKSMGGRLASLDDPKKMKFVSNMLGTSTESIWIGGECKGCTTVKDDKWEWSSGKHLPINSPMWKKYGKKDEQLPWDDSR